MPEKLDLDGDHAIYRGDTYTLMLRLKTDATTVEDLTGWTWLAQLRRVATDADPVAAFTVTCPAPATGEVTLALPTATTTALPHAGVWDLQGTLTGTVRTRLEGRFVVKGDVTR